jgi:hypothetical protein
MCTSTRSVARRAVADRGADGAALLLAVLLSLLLLTMGLAALWYGSSATTVAARGTRRQEALGAAEAGVERARALLATASASAWTTLLAGCGDVALPGKGHLLCDGGQPLQNQRVIEAGSASAAKAAALDKVTFTLFLRNDPVEVAAGSPEADANGRVIVRSEGLARDGRSFAAVEVVVTRGAPGGAASPPYMQAGLNAQGSNSMRGAIQ